jgi:hypothetical protein
MKLARFSLRVLFLVVTIAAAMSAWLGFELHVIAERKAFLKNVLYFGKANYISNPRPHTDLPFYRKWLGDTEVERIDAQNEADADRAAVLFPELRELYFVRNNWIINYDGDRSIPRQLPGRAQ